MVTPSHNAGIFRLELAFAASSKVFTELIIMDGILLENGISFKYYSADNFLKPGHTNPKHLGT